MTHDQIPAAPGGDGPGQDGPGAALAGAGTEPAARSVTKLTDPRALRGESSASASFHLRQLAKYGLVEEAGGGRGRERPWRATAMAAQWPDVAEGAEQQAATGLLSSVIAERYFEDLMRWLSAKPDESPE